MATSPICSQIESGWLETLLHRHVRENSTARVVDFTIEDAVVKGENYASQIYRIKLNLILGSGRKSKKSLIMKVPIVAEDGSSLIEIPVFKSEIFVYRKILSEFEALIDEFQDPNDKFWCEMIGYKPYNVIILEDLKARNFKVADRRDCLDLKHALLVLHKLGRFHAISHVLLKRGILNKDDLDKHYMESGTKTTERIMEGTFQQLACVMEKHWAPEWNEAAQKYSKEAKLAPKKLRKTFEFPKDGFLVLNHGDCWTCNLMFKYSSYEEDTPIDVRFIDFQLSHFNSYILDVVRFLYMSVRPDIRRTNIDRLFTEYQKSLESSLNFYGMADVAPTLKDVHAEAKRVAYLGMFFCMAILPITMVNLKDSFCMEKLNSDCEPKEIYNPESFKSEKFRKWVEKDVEMWIREGLI